MLDPTLPCLTSCPFFEPHLSSHILYVDLGQFSFLYDQIWHFRLLLFMSNLCVHSSSILCSIRKM